MKKLFILSTMILPINSLIASQTPTLDQIAADLTSYKQTQTTVNAQLNQQLTDANNKASNIFEKQNEINNITGSFADKVPDLNGIVYPLNSGARDLKTQTNQLTTDIAAQQAAFDTQTQIFSQFSQETNGSLASLNSQLQIISQDSARDQGHNDYQSGEDRKNLAALIARVVALETR